MAFWVPLLIGVALALGGVLGFFWLTHQTAPVINTAIIAMLLIGGGAIMILTVAFLVILLSKRRG